MRPVPYVVERLEEDGWDFVARYESRDAALSHATMLRNWFRTSGRRWRGRVRVRRT